MALLLVGVMAVSLFTGCSTESGETNGTAVETQASESAAAETGTTEAGTTEAEEASISEEQEPVEIVWWNGDTGAKTFWDEKVSEFNETIGKENNIILVSETSPDATAKEIAMQNGEGADILGVTQISKNVEAGWYMSLDDIPQLADLVAANDSVREDGTNAIDGKLYCLPVTSQLYGLAYNKDLFKAAGIVDENGEAKPPATYEEMLEDARILTDASIQQFGLILPVKWSGFAGCEIGVNAMTNNGYGLYDPSRGEFDFSGVVPVMDMIMTMKEEGLIYPGADGLDNDPARARFAEGNVGMKFCVSWDVAVWNSQYPAKCDWGVAPLPSEDADTVYYQRMDPGFSYGINKARAEEPGRLDKIAVVYNWLYSDEMQIEEYESCVSFPWRTDIIEKADASNITQKGWSDFGELIGISAKQPATLPNDLNGGDSWETSVINEVWSGQKTPEQWCEEVNAQYKEAVEFYNELHPDEDYSDRIIPDWKPETR